ncbi:MAG: glycoside hydrolase family 95 protein, partial [Bryobacteraceae bacterium]|nr:glycoside hydrolase family 95 protein [Bryobacteraceae bacterium]
MSFPCNILLSLLLNHAAAGMLSAQQLTLWEPRPAAQWEEALPVGNGRLGAMVFGGPADEKLQLNEHTVWTGEPRDYAHPGAHKHLAEIRRLLWAGRQKEAEALAQENFMSVPLRQMDYQPLGDLLLRFAGIDQGKVTGYRRALDLDSAVASVEFDHKGVRHRREVFASYPDQAIFVRLTAGGKGNLHCAVLFQSPHEQHTLEVSGDGLTLRGRVSGGAIRFEARLSARLQGGKARAEGASLVIEGADSVTLKLVAATNFVNYRDVSADPAARNAATVSKLGSKTYENLRQDHIADHQRLFRRVRLELPNSAAAQRETSRRIREFAAGHDPSLVALVFQYGRYLLIASSREGGQPANLQGLWNALKTPPWGSKYTVNINTEMNYWPAEVTNLPETHAALFGALREVAASGASTARQHYNAGGWVLHHNFDLWRGTAPINHANHGIWPTGGAWLCRHLWEHYLYGGDTAFLRSTAYPLMKGAAQFFVDTLVATPDGKWLVTGPSNSPENGGLVMAPAMDRQIVRELFANTIAAAEVLNTDPQFRDRLQSLSARLAPDRIGRHGQLQEWLEDADDPGNTHRHVSHLYALYPGAAITPATPELFRAARQSLVFRGDGATGWSMGWKVNLWARLL